jgi:thiosulfate/3-mercaptopyruvate sulfurtransferase
VEQLAPYEKVFVDKAFLDDPNHGFMECQECHGGDPAESDWLMAHVGVVRDPTYPDPGAVCGDCHPDIVERSSTSLHISLQPFYDSIKARATSEQPALDDMLSATKAHCGDCHASCGQCHVSRPTYVGGGFLDSHRFQKTPPMREVCTACHGSRIEKEYFGKNEGAPPDVHWRKRFFTCDKCHTGEEMHGNGTEPRDRYHVAAAPACEQCHEDIYAQDAANQEQHATHKGRVSCQVCHSVSYKNCYNCHFALDKYGFEYFKSEESGLDFKIGRNPRPSGSLPEPFVVLRHVPANPGLFDYYVQGKLTDFAASPTWKPATPHNIRRRTPQNESCNACHDNAKLFLLPSDLRPGYQAANEPVAVPRELLPKPVQETASRSADRLTAAKPKVERP